MTLTGNLIAWSGNPGPGPDSGPETPVFGGGLAAGMPPGVDKLPQCAYNVRLTAGGRLCHAQNGAQQGVVISEYPEREQALSLHSKMDNDCLRTRSEISEGFSYLHSWRHGETQGGPRKV